MRIGCIYLDEACAEAIGRCKNLEYLAVYDPCTSEFVIAQAPWLKNLKTLSLADCSVDDIVQAASGSSKLENLNVTPVVSPATLTSLQKCKNLSFLQITSPGGRDKHSLGLDDDRIVEIGRLTQLKTLHLVNVKVFPRQLEELQRKLPELKILCSGREVGDKWFVPYKPSDIN